MEHGLLHEIRATKREIKEALRIGYEHAPKFIEMIKKEPLYEIEKHDYLTLIEFLKRHPTVKEYLKEVGEFAGVEPKLPERNPSKILEEIGLKQPKTHEVEMEVPEREARTAERARQILTRILSHVEPMNGKVGIPLKAIELAKKELEIERHVEEKAFELLGTLERNSLVEGILDEEIVRIGREIREVRGKDVLNEAIEDANQKIWELGSKVARLVIAKRISLLNLLIRSLSEVLRNPQRYGILNEEGKLYVDYQMFITEVYPRLERALKEK